MHHWTTLLGVQLNHLCSVHKDHYYHDPYSDMPCLSLVDRARAFEQIQAGSTTKWIVEFVSGVGQENVCLAIMQSINEHHWTVMGPAGENCWCHSHHLQDFRQIVVDEWNAKHSVFFNLHSLITTGDRYIEVSLINVILELFSDDPPPYYQPHYSGYRNTSHYVSMNEEQNNQASIIMQDMWWKMLYWGR